MNENEYFAEVSARLSENEAEHLRIRPYLALYVEDDEDTLANAIERWSDTQEMAKMRLRLDGFELRPRMTGSDGEMHTTALRPETDERPEPLTVCLGDSREEGQ